MRNSSAPIKTAMLLAAGAVLIAALSSAFFLKHNREIASLLALVDEKVGSYGASLRGDAKTLFERIEGFEARLSGSIERRNELLSDISRKLDRLGREARHRGVDAVVKDGSAEGLMTRDIALARSLEEADRCYASGRYADAAARYAIVIAEIPGDDRIRQKRAISLYRANPTDSANYSLIEGELRNPAVGDNPQALEALAMISIERERWGKALEYLDRLIEQRPRDAEILKEAGECALLAGDVGLALDYLDKACSADSADEEAARLREKAREKASVGGDR